MAGVVIGGYYNDKAFDLAQTYGGLISNPNSLERGLNDQYDAYRHAWRSAELTGQFGSDLAKRIMDKWEAEHPNVPAEDNMDRWNNDIGRQEYWKWKEAYDKGLTTDPLSKWIYDKVKQGRTINDLSDTRQWIEPPPTQYPGTWEAEGWGGIDPYGLNVPWREAVAWRPRDPLAIDLDGDGIETVGIGSNPTLFDHNADGIKTGTGWVKADDAWVALDRDGNGSIDTGRELFGVDTQITVNGVTRNATSGFEALSTLDANADGSFNAADAEFANVRLWQDANQDGVSQSSELITLAQAGITAIGLTPSGGTVNLGNGNSITGQAVVTRSNGSTTAVGSVSVGGDTNAGNLNLADNPFYREFTDPVPLTEAAEDLPEMGGSGWVRDLREAMSLGTPEAQALAATVAAFAAASTRDAQMALLDQLLLDWAKTNQTQPTTNAWFTNATPAGGMIDPSAGVTAQLSQAVPVLEVFNGQAIQGSGTLYSTTTATSTVNGQSGQAIVLNGSVAGLLLQAYAALRESVYAALVVQTRLQPYLDSIELVINEDGIQFDTAALSGLLAAAQTADAANAIYDLVDLNRYASSTLQAVGFDVLATLRTWVDALPPESPLWVTLAGEGVVAGTSASGTEGRDYFLGDAGNGSFNGGSGDDAADGGAGADALSGGAGADELRGGQGDDSLNGNSGNDILDGGAGNDWLQDESGNNTYRFGRGDGQDTIAHYIDGVAGKLNTVQFKAGVAPSDLVLKQVYDNFFYGNTTLEVSIAGTTDKIAIRGYFYQSNPGSSYNPVQQFSFADGTVWDLAAINAAAFAGTAEADTITGTTGADTISGQAGKDTLSGGNGNDNLSGGDGADRLDGGAGNDTLDGGAGNDALGAGGGNNVYLFGRGDGQDIAWLYSDAAGKFNTLQFKDGVAPTDLVLKRVYDSDTYGQTALEVGIAGTTDKITISGYFYESNPGSIYNPVQQFRFADGTVWDIAAINAAVFAGTAGADSIIGLTGADTINGQAGNDTLSGGAGNDTLNGGDGADSLNGEAEDDTLDGGAGNDTLWGGTGNDSLSGGDGADTLNGDAGNDTLDGGAGNDTLAAGTGNNVYQFGRGDGQDTVDLFSDGAAGKLNTVQFKDGVAPSDLVLKQVYDSYFYGNTTLEVSIAGTTDKILLRGYFYQSNPGSSYNPVQQFSFADGTVWDLAAINAAAFAGTAEADTILGTTGADTISGQAGNDSLSGGNGNDNLSGGEGVDRLDGGAGNDTLDGGAGNDALGGGGGNNVYLFGRGDGQDIAWLYSDPAGRFNTVQFKDGVAPADLVLKRVYDSGTYGQTALEVGIAGTTDKITISGYFYENNPGGVYNPVQQFRFADGTVWDIATINAAVFAGTAGADTIVGTIGGDAISGQAGNDSLSGGSGNDTLNGGEGNDTLAGGTGNDTYMMARGFGAELVQENDSTSGNTDVVQFMADVSNDQIWFRRVGSDLEASIIGTADKMTLQSWYSGGAYHVEQFKTSDGKTLLDSQVQSLVDAMAGFAPPAMGQTTLPENYQTSLAPTIASSWGS